MDSSSTPTNVLTGRAALITGAARRLGAAIARGLHAEGASVCIHFHRSAREAEQLRDELNRVRANSATVFSADLLDVSAIPRIVDHAVQTFGRLDVLVNNASTFYP